jgi:hypothetical protein
VVWDKAAFRGITYRKVGFLPISHNLNFEPLPGSYFYQELGEMEKNSWLGIMAICLWFTVKFSYGQESLVLC